MSQTTNKGGSSTGLLDELPVDRLKEEVISLGKAMAKRGVAKLGESLSGAPGKLGDLGDAMPGPGDMVKAAAVAPVKGAASKVKDALPGMGSDDSDDSDDSGNSGGKGKVASMDSTNLKVTNIVETIDVPVSRETAYELWTQFEAFPAFMKKVESVQQKKPEEVTWKAQVFWSHRTWTAKIIDQVPPEHIVWKSEGDKGHVDGAVTFHELAPDLTRVLVSLEYFPQGLFERTGNLWRAQGRRVRLELKHYRRFVANHALLQQDEVDGWEGEIHDGKVKRQRGSSSAKKSGSSSSSARKSTSGGSSARKSTSGGSSARKSTSGGSAAKKTSASGSGSSSARKSTSGRSAAKKTASSGSSGSRSSGTSAAKKSASSGSTSRRTGAKKSASKRTAAAAKRSSTRSSTARSSTSKRTAPASRRPAKASASSSRSRSGGSSTRKSSSSRSSGSAS